VEVIFYRPAKSRLAMRENKGNNGETDIESTSKILCGFPFRQQPLCGCWVPNVLASSMAAMTCQQMHEIWGAAIVVGWPEPTMINAAHGSSWKCHWQWNFALPSGTQHSTIAFHNQTIPFGLFPFATRISVCKSNRIFAYFMFYQLSHILPKTRTKTGGKTQGGVLDILPVVTINQCLM